MRQPTGKNERAADCQHGSHAAPRGRALALSNERLHQRWLLGRREALLKGKRIWGGPWGEYAVFENHNRAKLPIQYRIVLNLRFST
jgi:hypothetical protein